MFKRCLVLSVASPLPSFAATPQPQAVDPCNPSPCGPNAVCRGQGLCECIPEYSGNPYEACRPECVLNPECPRDKACLRNKCRDPCPGTCGQNAQCDVVNHIPVCSCPQGFTGDPFSSCRLLPPGQCPLFLIVLQAIIIPDKLGSVIL